MARQLLPSMQAHRRQVVGHKEVVRLIIEPPLTDDQGSAALLAAPHHVYKVLLLSCTQRLKLLNRVNVHLLARLRVSKPDWRLVPNQARADAGPSAEQLAERCKQCSDFRHCSVNDFIVHACTGSLPACHKTSQLIAMLTASWLQYTPMQTALHMRMDMIFHGAKLPTVLPTLGFSKSQAGAALEGLLAPCAWFWAWAVSNGQVSIAMRASSIPFRI